MPETPHSEEGSATRAGYIALVGKPNVGKSTLLNAVVGDKLSIVTARAQTTRESVMGIYSGDGVQAIFVDTPGLLEPRYALQRSMVAAAFAALAESDVVLLLLDGSRPAATRPTGEALDRLQRRKGNVIVAVNKTDIAKPAAVAELASWSAAELGVPPHPVSAKVGAGVEALRDAITSFLPPGPFFYPEGDIATRPVRFFVAELVRETIFERYHEEIPYGTVVRIEEFRESDDPMYIRATIYVERKSQKPILIGRRGSAIKALGERAREKIQAFTGRRVYLDLWVKVLPGWRKKVAKLRYLGYRVSDEEMR